MENHNNPSISRFAWVAAQIFHPAERRACAASGWIFITHTL